MYWNYLMFVGFALRVYYHIVSDDYPFAWNLKSKDGERIPNVEGRKNIKLSTFSLFLVVVFWFIAFFLHNINNTETDLELIILAVSYIVIGWAIDSLFLFVADMWEKVLKSRITAISGVLNKNNAEEK